MKKLTELALIAVMSISLATGCTQATKPTSITGPKVLMDGTYTAVGEARATGWVPEISITVSNGKITTVTYDETAAMKKSEDYEYQKSFKAQGNIDLLTVYTALQNSLIKSQDAAKLDAVAGATKSAENFKALVAAALKDAKEGDKYKDGGYTAQGTLDERYWTPNVAITIKDAKITSVKYDEVSSKVFKNKSLDKAYIENYKNKKNVDLLTVYDNLQRALIEKQDATRLDAVAGATATYSSFTELTKKALEQAVKINK